VTSYWLDDEPFEPLAQNRLDGPVDVAVVGGGVTGCTAALVAARGGLRVRLHEAREISSGASGRSGGFALRGGAMLYDAARRELGAERAKQYWELTERALNHLEELAGDALRRNGSLRVAVDEAEREELEREHAALREDGFAADLVDGPFLGGIRHPTDGALRPGRWVRRLAALAADAGADLREQSRVESLDELDAEHVVIATDGYTQGLLPRLDEVIVPVRGQVIATEALPRRLFDCPHYARHGFDYWQQTDDNRLILGGRRDTQADHEFTAEETITEPIQRELETFAAELIGEPPKITHRWAGIFGQTPDLMPLAGRVPGHEGIWVAAGYSGHGNVVGLACGELVAQAILGRPAPELELFDPARLL
jgi:glycine/D-amino acid oxidase-like deaminating enzyme